MNKSLQKPVNKIALYDQVQGVVSLDSNNKNTNPKKTADYAAALSYVGATATELTLMGVAAHVIQITANKIALKFPDLVSSTAGGIVTKLVLGLGK